jgi:hypothetical protein
MGNHMDYAQKTRWLVETWAHGLDPTENEQARKQIATLNDLGFFEPLRAFLSEAKDKRERDIAYWMLESLLRKTGNADVGNYLMEQVGREKGAIVKTDLLRRVAVGRGRGVRIDDASNALDCLGAKMRNLRMAAVEALGSCGDPRAEVALIRIIGAQVARPTESGWFLYEAAWSLSEVATAKALPCALNLLERIDGLRIDGRKGDIKAMALKTVCRVGGGKQADVFAAALGDGSSAVVKWHAMRALAQHAKPKHVAAIAERVQTVLRGKRVIPQTEPPFIAPDAGLILFLLSEREDAKMTELSFAFEALARLSALRLGDLPGLLRKRWGKLTAVERAYLRSQVEEFGDLSE